MALHRPALAALLAVARAVLVRVAVGRSHVAVFDRALARFLSVTGMFPIAARAACSSSHADTGVRKSHNVDDVDVLVPPSFVPWAASAPAL